MNTKPECPQWEQLLSGPSPLVQDIRLMRYAMLGFLLEQACACPNASVLSITSADGIEDQLLGAIEEDRKQRKRNEKFDGGGRIKGSNQGPL